MKFTNSEYAEELARNASKILATLKVLSLWQNYGTPYLVGALAYGLAVAPDIDIEIYCDDPKIEHGFDILLHCAKQAGVRSTLFKNEINAADQGYYWQVNYRDTDNLLWKIDMWSVRHDHPGPTSRDMIKPMLAALTPEKRDVILDLKHKILQSTEVNCPSIKVYQAVFEENVHTWEDFRVWLRSHSDVTLVNWQTWLH